MNKLNKKLVVLGLLAVAGLSGCASVGSVANNIVNNKDKNGIICWTAAVTSTSSEEICKAIDNKDYR